MSADAISLPMSQTRRNRRIRWGYVYLWLVLLFIAVVWITPFIFMVFTSLKSPAELLGGSPFSPPTEVRWGNYPRAWDTGKIGQFGLNSLIITIIKVPLGILISALAAFVLSRLRFRFQQVLFLLFVMGTMIPVQVAMIPLFDTMQRANLLNTYIGVILPYIAFGLPYQIFLLRGFFKDIPRELDEAARIDGCSNFGLFWRVIIPLSIPALTALFIIDFVATWNEFAIALVLLPSPEMWTIPLGLQSFQGRFSTQYHLLNAAIVTSIVPVIVVYVLFQRYFISGLTTGAVKG
jgi:raffinose/stachyose/melibiose transport system permease protein